MSVMAPKKLTREELDSIDFDDHIPDMDYFTNHITRDLDDNKNEYDVFDYAMEKKINVLIEGPSGCGKTSAALAYAAKKQIPFYSVSSNAGIDPSQLFGRFIPDGLGGFKWVDGAVTSIVRHGGVLLLNEINFMPERISTVLFGLLDKRRSITLMDHESETIEAHDDVLIIADMNPGYEGTRPLNKAFRNRFPIQLVWDYDNRVENKLVTSRTLIKVAQDIRQRTVNGEYQTPFGTNMLIEFERLAQDVGFNFAVTSLVNHFTDSERQAVRTIIKNNTTSIKVELNPSEVTAEDDDLTINSKYPKDHPIWETRKDAEIGYFDKELGVKGIDWMLE